MDHFGTAVSPSNISAQALMYIAYAGPYCMYGTKRSLPPLMTAKGKEKLAHAALPLRLASYMDHFRTAVSPTNISTLLHQNEFGPSNLILPLLD